MAIYYFWPERVRFLRQDQALLSWKDFLSAQVKKFTFLEPVYVFAFLFPPLLIVSLALCLLEQRFLGVLYLVLSLVLFIWALGRLDIREQFSGYKKEWISGQGKLALDELYQGVAVEIDNDKQIHLAARSQLMYNSFQHVFCVLFWFALTGLLVPLIYRGLSVLCEASKLQEADMSSDANDDGIPFVTIAERMKTIIEWPATFVFACLFNFVADKKFAGFAQIENALLLGPNVDIKQLLHGMLVPALSFMSVDEMSEIDLADEKSSSIFYAQARLELEQLEFDVKRAILLFVAILAVIYILF